MISENPRFAATTTSQRIVLLPLIIYEKTGNWAAALRRALDEPAIRLIETRSLDECWQRLAERPVALVAWEVTDANLRAIVAGLVRLQREFPQAAAIVLAERCLAVCESLVREAGAIHFVDSPRKLDEVADIFERLAKQSARQSFSAQSLAQENYLAAVWAELPWSELHSSDGR